MPRCVFVAARHSRNHFLAALLSRHGFHSDAPHETAFLSWIPRTPFRDYFPSPSRSFTGWISAEPRRRRRSRISAADNFRGTDCALAPTHPVCSPADPRVQPQRPAICRAPLRPPGVLALASPPPRPPAPRSAPRPLRQPDRSLPPPPQDQGRGPGLGASGPPTGLAPREGGGAQQGARASGACGGTPLRRKAGAGAGDPGSGGGHGGRRRTRGGYLMPASGRLSPRQVAKPQGLAQRA